MHQPLAAVAVAVLAAATLPAHALGLGEPRTNAVLGQPIDVRLPLTGDGADALQPGCISVEVHAGDNRLPKEQVKTALERVSPTDNDTVLHLRTTVPVDEPVVQLDITVGCQGRLSRQYTLLPDPPRFDVPAQLPQTLAAPRPVDDAPVSIAALPPTPVAERAPALTAPRAPRAAAAERVRAPRPRPVRPSRTAIAAAPVAVPAPAAASAASAARQEAAPRVARAASAAPVAASAPLRGPRLSLEAPQVALRAPALPIAAAVAAPAASRAAAPSAEALVTAAAPAAGPATIDARTAQLADSLARLKAESQAQRETLARLEAQLAQRDDPLQRGTTWMTVTAVLALLAGALAWRLRQQRRHFEQGWWDSMPRR